MTTSETYDGFKARSDLDELLPEDESAVLVCDTCGGDDGRHDPRCPDSGAACDAVDLDVKSRLEGES